MKHHVALLLVFVAIALTGTAVAARRHAAVWRAAAGPEFLPADVRRGDAARGAWVFVRAGCRHCAAHLDALARAAAALPDTQRTDALRRIRVVGGMRAGPPGVAHVADSVRTRLGVRLAPTTWLVDADGRVRRAWRGARGSAAWADALQFLCGGDVP
jgi:hypothetical protein